MKNSFEKKENKGRALIEDKIKQSFKNVKWLFSGSTDSYNPIDIDFTGSTNTKEKTYSAEIKYRSNFDYSAFTDTVLEETKLSRLINTYKKGKTNPNLLYIMLWRDGTMEVYDVIQIWNLIQKGELKSIQKKMRKNNITYDYIIKTVYMLPRTLAKHTI